MFNLLTLAGGTLITLVALAKLHKSNKLFWTFLVSMLIGYAGGSVAKKISSCNIKKDNTTYVVPMYESATLTANYGSSAFKDTRAVKNCGNTVINSNRTGKELATYCVVFTSNKPSALNPEYDIGFYDTENTS